VEQHGHEVSGAGVNLVCEVSDRCAATQTDYRRAIATGNADATK
jgi:hypothetical protein